MRGAGGGRGVSSSLVRARVVRATGPHGVAVGVHVLAPRAVGANAPWPAATPTGDVAGRLVRVREDAHTVALDIGAGAHHVVWAFLASQALLGAHGGEEVGLVARAAGLRVRRLLALAAVAVARLLDVAATQAEGLIEGRVRGHGILHLERGGTLVLRRPVL